MFDLFPSPRPQRARFGQGIRKEVFRRQDGRCMYCGSRQRMDLMDVDHKIPVARGGSNQRSNLQLLCRICNVRKAAKTDREFRQAYQNAGVSQTQAVPSRTIRQSAFAAAGKQAQATRRKNARASRNPWQDWGWF